MEERRAFIRVSAKFDRYPTPKTLLIPIDSIGLVTETLAPVGGCEISWMDRDRPTCTHVQEDVNTIYRRLQGVEH